MKENLSKIKLRPITINDKEMIFAWRNTPFLIKLGSSGKAVTWEEHCKWFDGILNDRKSVLFIVNYENVPVGQVRFAVLEKDVYLASIYLLEKYIGKGIGTKALRMALELMWQEDEHRIIIAFIKSTNKASIRAFSKAGFVEINEYRNLPLGHIAMQCANKRAK